MLKKIQLLAIGYITFTSCNAMDHASTKKRPLCSGAPNQRVFLKHSNDLINEASDPITKSKSTQDLAAMVDAVQTIRLITSNSNSTNAMDALQSISILTTKKPDEMQPGEIATLINNKASRTVLGAACYLNPTLLALVMQTCIFEDNAETIKSFHAAKIDLSALKYNMLASACFYGSTKVVSLLLQVIGIENVNNPSDNKDLEHLFGPCFHIFNATPLVHAVAGKIANPNNLEYDKIIDLLQVYGAQEKNCVQTFMKIPLDNFSTICKAVNSLCALNGSLNIKTINFFIDSKDICLIIFLLQNIILNDDAKSLDTIFNKLYENSIFSLETDINHLLNIACKYGCINVVDYLLTKNKITNINYWVASKSSIKSKGDCFKIRRTTALEYALEGQKLDSENLNFSLIINLLKSYGATEESAGSYYTASLLPLDDTMLQNMRVKRLDAYFVKNL